LDNATVLEAEELGTVILINNGDLTFSRIELPRQVQFSSTNAISIDDYNGDGKTDVLLAGNFYKSKPEVGRYDASYGSLLIGDGDGGFELMPVAQSGLKLDGQVRGIARVKTAEGYNIVVVNNDDYAQMFTKRE
jgi:hypothetical protein